MQPTAYAEREGFGVYTRLSHASHVSMHTVLKSFRDGLPVSYETAEKLSAATNNECTIDELRFPTKAKAARKKKPKRTQGPEAA